VGENTQTAYALALQFDLLPEELRPVAAERLAEDVRRRKHLTTGFLGTPYLCHVLAATDISTRPTPAQPRGVSVVALSREAGRHHHLGALGRPEAGRHLPGRGMNSFNHYAYGAIGDWMYRVMAGIDIGRSRARLQAHPHPARPGGGFTEVKASHETPYGKVASAWTLKDGAFDLRVEVPANTRATVRLPSAQLARVTEGGQPLAGANGIGAPRQDGDTVVVEVGSGAYRFSYPWKADDESLAQGRIAAGRLRRGSPAPGRAAACPAPSSTISTAARKARSRSARTAAPSRT
jgi:alpha-L-rhamnosidase